MTSGSFVASDNVFEPDVFAVLPSEHLSAGVLKPGPMIPLDKGILERREDPAANDAIEHWPGFLERDHAQWNNFYSLINQDDPRVTAANQCNYKSEFDTWLYDRASSMFVLYMRSGFLLPLREAVRNTDFYRQQLYTGSGPAQAVGIFKMKSPDPSAYIGGNGAMYSYNECLAYMHWLTGDNDVLPHVGWVVTAHENQDEPTRWSPSEAVWTERHTAYRLLANSIAYELTGEAQYRTRMLEQSADFIKHQDGAGGLLPANRVDGGLYHYGRQHGDGTENELVASSWMMVITIEAMTRAWALALSGYFADLLGMPDPTLRQKAAEHLRDLRQAARLSASPPGFLLRAARTTLRSRTTTMFTDDPLVSQATPVKAVHVTEIRAAVAAFRTLAGLPAATFEDTSPDSTVSIKAIHLTQLRDALDAARSTLSLLSLSYTDPSITAGATVVKAIHFEQLRAGVK